MTKSNHSSFWTTGIWVLLRYLALPIMIITALLALSGPGYRAKVTARLHASIEPLHERYLAITGQSELLQSRIHVRDPELAGVQTLQLGDLPVVATVPVVNLDELPQLDGPGVVHLSDLPEPIENTVIFLKTRPDAMLAVPSSPRPSRRPALSPGN